MKNKLVVLGAGREPVEMLVGIAEKHPDRVGGILVEELRCPESKVLHGHAVWEVHNGRRATFTHQAMPSEGREGWGIRVQSLANSAEALSWAVKQRRFVVVDAMLMTQEVPQVREAINMALNSMCPMIMLVNPNRQDIIDDLDSDTTVFVRWSSAAEPHIQRWIATHM